MSRPHGHSAAGRIKSKKNPNDPMENRTHDLPACNAVPQPTAPRRTPEQNLQRRKRRRAHMSTRGALRSWHPDLSTSFVPVLNSNNIQTNPHTLLAFILSMVPTFKTETMLVHGLLLNAAARFVTTVYWLRNFSPFVRPTADHTTCS